MTDLNQVVDELKKHDINLAQQIVGILKTSMDEKFLRLNKEIQDVKALLTRANLVQRPCLKVVTEHPVALDSWDHKQPRGTINDDTRCFPFVKRTEEYFGRKVRFCDLGCAGGGLVFDFLSNHNFAIGIDGSDISRRLGRAHWGVIPDCLMVADLTKPFSIVNAGNSTLDLEYFDVISAWEVMEHIPESAIPVMLNNVYRHLEKNGIFACSVSTEPDQDPNTGAVWHVTVRPKEWWLDVFKTNGFRPVENHPYVISDFPRGAGNLYAYAGDWDARKAPHIGFHLIAEKS